MTMKRYSISQRKKSRGNLTWYGRTYEGGILVSEVSLATKRKSDAQAWLDSMNASKFLPENMFRINDGDRGVSEAVDKFLQAEEAEKGRLSATYEAYRSRLKSWTSWCGSNGIVTLRGFTRERAVEWSNEVSSEYSAKTARERIRLIRQFTEWAAETFEIGNWEPMKTVKPPKLVKRAKAFWTPSEVDRILDCAPDRLWRLFWSLMAFAGLRHAEACRFGPECLSDGRMRIVGKGNKEAFLPVGGRLSRELESVPLSQGMFDVPKFRGSNSSMSALRSAVEKAGLPAEGATNHRFRHSFASNLIRSGVNVKAVQQLMRHEQVQVTLDTYSHLLQEDLQSSVDAL